MLTDEELDALIARLDPGVRIVVELLRRNNRELLARLEQLREQQEQLTAQNAELRRMLFGPRSEKMPSMASEVRRALEADELIGPVPTPGETVGGDPPPSPTLSDEEKRRELEKKRRAAGRKRSEAERASARAERKRKLPVITETVHVTPEQLPEGYDLSDFRVVGPGSTVRRYEHVREHLVAVDYVLETLASSDGEHIIAAKSPASVQEGGLYGPGVYARVVVGKTDDSLPLHRMAKIFARDGVPIAPSTLGSLFHRAAELLTPIYNELCSIAQRDPYINADETRMPVQAKGKCRKAWVWTFITKDIIVYKHNASRASSVAEEFLQGTSGTLQIDGYSGYNSSCKDGGRERVGCYGHARRGFFICRRDNPEADYVLERIVQLYLVEYRAAEQDILGTQQHLELRQALSKPITEELIAWCREHEHSYNPKSPMASAIGYMINQWASLTAFLKDPRLRLDNNVSERALRINALGRKNFLFVGTDDAGQNLAILQTIVATCKLHKVNPYDYITDVLIRIQTHPKARTLELLPMSWSATAS
jgi:transposase